MSKLWLTKSSTEPPAVLATTLVRRLGLNIPVAIDTLAREVADVSYEPWPFAECDAIVVGLLSRRPSIFLRKGLHHRRERFTLAHEYGHIKMGWHIGVVGCSLRREQFEEEPLESAPGSDLLTSWWRLEEQEAEATRFASYLLMPEDYLRPIVEAAGIPEVLQALNLADVSATAALMRLRSLLQPGFCFVVSGNSDNRLFASPGTSLGRIEAGSEIEDLREIAYESGYEIVGERRVDWFRLTDFAEPEKVRDPRNTTELARTAIRASELDPEKQVALYQSINGVVGGSLSKERAESVTQALAILRHKFNNHPAYGSIPTHPDFDLYLRRKAEEWAEKRGLLSGETDS